MTRPLARALPVLASAVVLGVTAVAAFAATGTTATTSASASTTTAAVVSAAEAFLDTLTTSQQETVLYDYSSSERSAWSNLPVGSGRNGIKLGDLSTTQQAAAMAVVDAMLSEQGQSQVDQIMTADSYLSSSGGGTGYGSGLYYLALFGTPTATGQFGVQFGGHHLAINADFNDGNAAITPDFVGVEPQTWTADGTTYTPMNGEKTAVFAVLDSLSTTEQSAAKISGTFTDVVKGAGTDAQDYPTDQGILVSSLSDDQQALVTTAIEQWVGDFTDEISEDYLAAYEADYDQTYLGWGNTTSSTGTGTGTTSGTYFRISGPAVWIEYVHQAGVVLSGLHIHTIFRDKTSDYTATSTTTSVSTTDVSTTDVPTTDTSTDSVTQTSTTTASLKKKRLQRGRHAVVRIQVTSAVAAGRVQVLVDGDVVRTRQLTAARAGQTWAVRLPKLAVGRHRVRVVYEGTTGVTGSASSVLRLRVIR
ncbi:DUF3500 domain-containing protein [Nocardioides sp.]|uniref:DUF3500 domain-containing protein n=1 Tax=Nocardioides sp. TaxID=35761 RepID=UPI0039E2E870